MPQAFEVERHGLLHDGVLARPRARYALRDMVAGRATFTGNLDPTAVLARGKPAAVEAVTHALLPVFARSRRFVRNAGCAIAAPAPPENIRAMIRAARQGCEQSP